jgi:NADP-dependent 3-hydroxy acid dehydrogenase YdfG
MMLAQRDGCIVNISSVFGLVGFPMHSAYNMNTAAGWRPPPQLRRVGLGGALG